MSPPTRCPGCGTELAPALLVCPTCQRLVHGAELEKLRAQAEHPDTPHADAIAAWRSARALVPNGTKQARIIEERIAALTRDGPPPEKRAGGKLIAAGGGLTGIALLLLSKGKFLLLGLTKLSTFSTMILAFGVYWSVWGWPFALGLVLSIYVHEMGHVAALRRYGVPASAPMFVPGLGAFVRLGAGHLDPRADARTGLAGPVWGLAAAIACGGLYFATKNALFLALAHTGAVINLFNLIPVWQLDGARGLRTLSKQERIVVAIVAGASFFLAREVFLLVIAALAAWRAREPADEGPDRGGLGLFALLLVALSAVAAASAHLGPALPPR